VTTAELELEIIDALRFGASPIVGITERVRCDSEEVLDILLHLESRDLVRRRKATSGTPPAHHTWWELTAKGDAISASA
jgi:hypothetical protein